jgi:GGDEF domain-containing protein
VARLGGDEFAVLCPGVATEAAATDIAGRVTASLTAPVRSSAGEHRRRQGS